MQHDRAEFDTVQFEIDRSEDVVAARLLGMAPADVSTLVNRLTAMTNEADAETSLIGHAARAAVLRAAHQLLGNDLGKSSG
ncbi:MAG: hypothetical protein AAF747_01680 [Planctomycetota bacterium]